MGNVRSFYGPLLDQRIEPNVNSRRVKSIIRICLIVIIVASLIAVATTTSMNQKKASDSRRTFISYNPEIVASFGDVGQYSSLVIDSSTNYPIIVSYSAPSGLTASIWGGTEWWNLNGTSLPPLSVGQYCSATMNASNYLITADYEATYGDLYGNWGPIDSIGDVGKYTSIAINPVTNTTAISYYDVTNDNLKVAINLLGMGWTNTTVDQVGDVGQYTNIIFTGANNSLNVLYYDVTNGDLKRAWQWGGTGPWHNETLWALGDVGMWPSQAMLGDTYLCWSFCDVTEGDLICMSRDWGSFPFGDTWASPDIVGDVGQYSSIGVNSTGHVFISYYDATNGDLKLTWNESTVYEWYNVTLDSIDNVGRFTSLKIDSNDTIHVSYYDATNGDLKYVKITASEIALIPEFSDVLPTIIGIIAIFVISSKQKKHKKGI